VPELLKNLPQNSLSKSEQQAKVLLQNWNEDMDVNSPAASIWWTFWTNYVKDTFNPWWKAGNVPTAQHPELSASLSLASLDEDLETWTLNDPNNAAFTLPNGSKRDASSVMLQAFQESVGELSKALGDNSMQWQWGKLNTRKISSLLGTNALSYGPRPSGGDKWTLLSTGGSLGKANDPTLTPSTNGPSWRIVVDWGTGQAEGTYPGGQEENPASSWYENQISYWWNGQYYPIVDGATVRHQPDSVIWTFSK
jgi:penicillin amidase